MVELKYYLDKKTLKTGAEKNFMKRHFGWYIYSIVAGVICIGFALYLILNLKGFEVMPYVLILLGVMILFKKQLYLNKVVRNAFAGKAEKREVHCKFSEDEIWMSTQNSTGSTKWDGIYDVIITDAGILLYPQKSIHQWIPKSAEIINGDWEELVRLSASVSRRKKHLPLQ